MVVHWGPAVTLGQKEVAAPPQEGGATTPAADA